MQLASPLLTKYVADVCWIRRRSAVTRNVFMVAVVYLSSFFADRGCKIRAVIMVLQVVRGGTRQAMSNEQ